MQQDASREIPMFSKIISLMCAIALIFSMGIPSTQALAEEAEDQIPEKSEEVTNDPIGLDESTDLIEESEETLAPDLTEEGAPLQAGEFLYSLNDEGKAILEGIDKDARQETLVLPVSVDGIPVVEIADGAFKGNEDITRITFETIETDGVEAQDESYELKTIGKEAFMACSNLEVAELPDSVIEVGEKAFANCPSLTTVIAAKLTSFDEKAFEGSDAAVVVTRGATANEETEKIDGVIETKDAEEEIVVTEEEVVDEKQVLEAFEMSEEIKPFNDIAAESLSPQASYTESEPNDYKSQANPLTLGKSYTGKFYKPGFTGDPDYYSFTITKPSRITIKFTPPSSSSSAKAAVIDLDSANGKVAYSWYVSMNGKNSTVTNLYVPAGTYYLLCGGLDSWASWNKNYRVYVNAAAASYTELENNNSFSTATPMKIDKSYTATAYAPGWETTAGVEVDNDFWSFSAPGGKRVHFKMSLPSSSRTNTAYTVSLWDKNKKLYG